MRNCREASGPLDVSEVPLSTTAGGAGEPLGDNINIYEVMKLTEYYLSDNDTAKHKLVPEWEQLATTDGSSYRNDDAHNGHE